jgi:hypothetical protein
MDGFLDCLCGVARCVGETVAEELLCKACDECGKACDRVCCTCLTSPSPQLPIPKLHLCPLGLRCYKWGRLIRRIGRSIVK